MYNVARGVAVRKVTKKWCADSELDHMYIMKCQIFYETKSKSFKN